MISIGAQIIKYDHSVKEPKFVSRFQSPDTGGSRVAHRMCPGKKTPGGRLRQSPIDSFPSILENASHLIVVNELGVSLLNAVYVLM